MRGIIIVIKKFLPSPHLKYPDQMPRRNCPPKSCGIHHPFQWTLNLFHHLPSKNNIPFQLVMWNSHILLASYILLKPFCISQRLAKFNWFKCIFDGGGQFVDCIIFSACLPLGFTFLLLGLVVDKGSKVLARLSINREALPCASVSPKTNYQNVH